MFTFLSKHKMEVLLNNISKLRIKSEFLWSSGHQQKNILVSSYIHSSSKLYVKTIVEKKENKNILIEGVVSSSERIPYLLKTEHDHGACPICRLNVNVKHTDVLILSQFVRKDGCMLPKRITGLCDIQQKRMSKLVSMAHIAGLMPNLVPAYSKKNCFKKRREWKKYNTYFDENTIEDDDDTWYPDNDKIKQQYYEEQCGISYQRSTNNVKQNKNLVLSPRKLTFY